MKRFECLAWCYLQQTISLNEYRISIRSDDNKILYLLTIYLTTLPVVQATESRIIGWQKILILKDVKLSWDNFSHHPCIDLH
jgi:hypothetical protein